MIKVAHCRNADNTLYISPSQTATHSRRHQVEPASRDTAMGKRLAACVLHPGGRAKPWLHQGDILYYNYNGV